MVRINLWSGPRNISTAMMYSFAQRPGCTVVDEPLYAYFLQYTGIDHPGRQETLESMSSDKDVVLNQMINKAYKGSEVFFKNMAHHFLDIPFDILKHFKNVFLIRDPKYVIASYIKERDQPLISDLGYEIQLEMLNYLKEQKQDYLLVDSSNILKNPKVYLDEVCNFCGIEFDEKMLKWEAGPRKEDGIWAKYWYESVHQSTGFIPFKEKNVVLPERLQPLLRDCENIYQILQAEAIKI